MNGSVVSLGVVAGCVAPDLVMVVDRVLCGECAASTCCEMNFDDSEGTTVLLGTSISCGGKILYVVAAVCGTGKIRTAGVEGSDADIYVCAVCMADVEACEGDSTLSDGLMGEAPAGEALAAFLFAAVHSENGSEVESVCLDDEIVVSTSVADCTSWYVDYAC